VLLAACTRDGVCVCVCVCVWLVCVCVCVCVAARTDLGDEAHLGLGHALHLCVTPRLRQHASSGDGDDDARRSV
jgi:hypothetical protein